MDRNTFLGIALIFILTSVWMYLTVPSPDDIQQIDGNQQLDSLITAQPDNQHRSALSSNKVEEKQETPIVLGQQDQIVEFIEIATPVQTITFSTKGGGPVQFLLLNYLNSGKVPLSIVKEAESSVFDISFLDIDNRDFSTSDYFFQLEESPDKRSLVAGESTSLSYRLYLNQGYIQLNYTIYADKYSMDVNVEMNDSRSYLIGRSVEMGWNALLNLNETIIQSDIQELSAYIYTADELERFLYEGGNERSRRFNGNMNWVATRTKFFTQIIKPNIESRAGILSIQEDYHELEDEKISLYQYRAYVEVDIPSDNYIPVSFYVGPLDNEALAKFDITAWNILDIGWGFIRFFSEPLIKWVVIPSLRLFSSLFGNYGWAIILFALLVKLVLYPLTRKSFKSMSIMKELQPEIQKIQKKYKNNQQKQQAILKLYKNAGANPLGGCLPMLLQFPILISLWSYFRYAILLRQESFLWINDLSSPDYILSLPFAIPFIGDKIAGMVLISTLVNIIQIRVTGSEMAPTSSTMSNEQAKIMKLIMQFMLPVMLFVWFNNYASGLSLYYFIYIISTFGQQLWVRKQQKKNSDKGFSSTG